MYKNQVRIISGIWKRRLLSFPNQAGLRPTPDRARETLFNWLGQDLTGKTCLDLFAGSGALGFEAASRGAKQVIMVENHRPTYASLIANFQQLGTAPIEILYMGAVEYLAQANNKFDIIFVDPPYTANLLPQILPQLSARLTPEGLVYCEANVIPDLTSEWHIVRQSRAGKVHYFLLSCS